jgi:hypothetical protein
MRGAYTFWRSGILGDTLVSSLEARCRRNANDGARGGRTNAGIHSERSVYFPVDSKHYMPTLAAIVRSRYMALIAARHFLAEMATGALIHTLLPLELQPRRFIIRHSTNLRFSEAVYIRPSQNTGLYCSLLCSVGGSLRQSLSRVYMEGFSSLSASVVGHCCQHVRQFHR